jgi:hypothetical protein
VLLIGLHSPAAHPELRGAFPTASARHVLP